MQFLVTNALRGVKNEATTHRRGHGSSVVGGLMGYTWFNKLFYLKVEGMDGVMMSN